MPVTMSGELKPEAPQSFEEFLKLHRCGFRVDVDVELPQIDNRDAEEVMALVAWAADFEKEHGRYPDDPEMHAFVEARKQQQQRADSGI